MKCLTEAVSCYVSASVKYLQNKKSLFHFGFEFEFEFETDFCQVKTHTKQKTRV
jgi:hypothetical protein